MAKGSYHHADLRRALLTGARTRLEADGPEHFSLTALARDVGVTSAAPYHHFRDKAELLQAVAEEMYVGLRTGMELAWSGGQEGEPADVVAAARRVAHVYLRFSIEHPVLFQMAMVTARPAPDSEAYTRFVAFQLSVRAVLEQRGVFAASGSDDGIAMFFCVLRGVVAEVAEAPRLVPRVRDPYTHLDRMLDLTFRALRG
ncbi:MAG: transcriptional regulator, TetR family [Frankiales bacterium]|nr:transcriptional regulator, TetR family [Frankiales bacterium]